MSKSNKCVLSIRSDKGILFACEDVTNECRHGRYDNDRTLHDHCINLIDGQCRNILARKEVASVIALLLIGTIKEKK